MGKEALKWRQPLLETGFMQFSSTLLRLLVLATASISADKKRARYCPELRLNESVRQHTSSLARAHKAIRLCTNSLLESHSVHIAGSTRCGFLELRPKTASGKAASPGGNGKVAARKSDRPSRWSPTMELPRNSCLVHC